MSIATPIKMCPECFGICYAAKARCDFCGKALTLKQQQKDMQAACDRFNAEHAVGETIHVWTGPREGKPAECTIRFPATILGGHTPVVYVSGGGGCVALTHVASWRDSP